MGKCGLVRVFRDGSYALEINGVVIISDDDIDPFAKNIRAASARSSWSSCGPAKPFEQLRRGSAAARATSCSSCARTPNERHGGEGERTCGWKKNSCSKSKRVVYFYRDVGRGPRGHSGPRRRRLDAALRHAVAQARAEATAQGEGASGMHIHHVYIHCIKCYYIIPPSLIIYSFTICYRQIGPMASLATSRNVQARRLARRLALRAFAAPWVSIQLNNSIAIQWRILIELFFRSRYARASTGAQRRAARVTSTRTTRARETRSAATCDRYVCAALRHCVFHITYH